MTIPMGLSIQKNDDVPSYITVMPVLHSDASLSKMTNNIMTCEAKMFDLVMEVSKNAKNTRMEWLQTRSTATTDLDAIFEERVIVNYMGRTTVIPDYETYNNNWRRVFHCNPFEVEWLNYDNDAIVNKYISVALDTLQKQMLIWSADVDTRVSMVFIFFQRFIGSLERLYDYAMENFVLNLDSLKISSD